MLSGALPQVLEVEEEFDLVKLGFLETDGGGGGLTNEKVVRDETIVKDENVCPIEQNGPRIAASSARFTRPNLTGIRKTSGRYASADWSPDVSLAPEESPSPPIAKDVIAHDYADPSSQVTDVSESTPANQVEAHGHQDGLVRDITAHDQPPVAVTGGSASSTPSLASGVLTSTETTAATPILAPTKPKTYTARLVNVRRPGRKCDRIGIRVIRRKAAPSDLEDEADSAVGSVPLVEISPPPRTPPDSHFLRELQTLSSSESESDITNKLRKAARLHNTTGTLLPEVLRDLLPALADRKQAVQLANELRRNFDVPQLPARMDRIALVKVLAQMRERLYIELAAAMILPNAPPELPPESPNGEKKNMSMAPSSFDTLSRTLPLVFHNDRTAIKAVYDSKSGLYGEEGDVVWMGGVGRMRSRLKDGQSGLGYRGEEGDGLVHAFVDHSNILHGLAHHLYSSPLPLPPRHQRILALPCLSLLLLRGRPTRSAHLVASSPLLQNLDPLVRLGWEVSVLKRVEVYEDEVVDAGAVKLTPKAVPRTPAGPGGAGGGGTRRYKEQGVDEILTLKMLQLVNRVEVKKESTIVLATGDARGGQFNKEGFLGAVREAVGRGWIVELWSFSSGLSRAWKETAKREGWDGHFRIYTLDDWAGELVEVNEDAE